MLQPSSKSTPSRPALRARRVAISALDPGDLERWTALSEAALEPNPFFEPDFVLAAAAHLGEARTSLVVVEEEDDGGAWRACLPVQYVRLGGAVPAVRTWCHRYCFLGTPLLDPAAPAAAAQALLRHSLGRGLRPLVLEHQRDDGPVAQALRIAAAELNLETVFTTTHERALLERSTDGAPVESLSSRRRRDLDRLARRLEAELGVEPATRDEAGDDSAIDAFIALERSGWKGSGGTALASDPHHVVFFQEVCRSFAARGKLELLTLGGPGRRAAMACNLYSGDGGFAFKVAHDAELRRFSPGVQLELASMRIFQGQRTELWQDSCADPENTMINRLWPQRRRIATRVLAPRGLRAAVLRRAIGIARTRERKRRSEASP